MSMYKKPINVQKGFLKTVEILVSAAFLAIVGFLSYYIAKDGIQAVLAWFQGKWFCMVAMILIVAGSVCIWIFEIVKLMKRTGDSDGK